MNHDLAYIKTSLVPASDVGGALAQFLSTGVQFPDDTLDVLIGTLRPGVFVPLHSHSGPEWFFLLEGEIEAYTGTEVGGSWNKVRANDFTVIPAGVRHAWRNLSDAPARVLSFAGSSIFEVMRKLAVPAGQAHTVAAPSAEFLQELQAIATASGNWIASPEENAAIGLHFQLS